jgi:hypothetical protein
MAGYRRVSPDEMLNAAKAEMLDGREPADQIEWATVVNFLAFNMAPEIAESGCQLMRVLYDMPLCPEVVSEIVAFQLASKAKHN